MNQHGTKSAIVTGGASGIGRAIATALVVRGVSVVLADIDGARAEATADGLNEAGRGKAFGHALDVRDAAAVSALVEQTARRFGTLDYLFNNAGIHVVGEADDLSAEHWDRVLDVNLRGVMHGVRAAYPLMSQQGFGHIVNTSSLGGLMPYPLSTPYAMAKWGVAGLSLSLRCEAADRGVKVTVVCPGMIDTPLLDGGPPSDLPPVSSWETSGARASLLRTWKRAYRPDRLAADILHGVDRNQAVVIAPSRARLAWRLGRLSPSLALRAAITSTRKERALRAG